MKRSGAALPAFALVASAMAILGLPWLVRDDVSNRAWGLNVVHYLPPGVHPVVLAAGLAALVAGIAAAVLGWPRIGAAGGGAPGARGAGGGAAAGAFFSRRGLPAQILLCVGVAAVLWVAREQIHFLSDTLLRLRSIYRLSIGEGPVSAFVLHAAPLDYNLSVRLPVWLASFGALDIFQSAQLVPCLLGAAFAAVAIRVAALTGGSGASRALALVALLTQGYMELFAGYCKGHGLLLTVLLGWCAAVMSEERDGRKPGWSVFLLGLALLTHRTALLLVPAQGWLLWRAYGMPGAGADVPAALRAAVPPGSHAPGPGRVPARRRARARAWAFGFAALSAALLAVSMSGVAHKDVQFLARWWNPGPEPGAYPLLSATHAGHVLNDLFLLAPLGLAAALLALVGGGGGRRVPGRAALLAAGLPFLAGRALLGHVFEVQGAMRDWDNFAAAGLFLGVFAALSVSSAVDRHARLAGLATAAVLAAALHTGAWLWLNADPRAALARVEDVGRGAPPLQLSARAMLHEYRGEYLELEDRPAESAEAYLAATELAPNPRFFLLAGTQLWKAGLRARAVDAFRAAARDPANRARMLDLAQRKLAADPGDAMQAAILDASASPPRLTPVPTARIMPGP